MAIGPSINTNIRSISFPVITTDASPIYTMAPLAPSTGSVIYQSGTLLAQYTAGGNVGMFVNYDSVSGTNGQNVFVGVLLDDLIVQGTTVVGQVQIAIMLTKGAFYKSALQYTQIADVNAAITQRNAKVVYDYNRSGDYLVYGL
jgi:hypothetical protein